MFIGIDLGTSGVKALLVDREGNVLSEISKTYPIYYPYKNYSEQNPKDWWNATKEALQELLYNQDKQKIRGISFGGQMHGLVALDQDAQVVRPAILWNDGRTVQEVEQLNIGIGKRKLMELTGNIAFAGFTATKLLWMKKNEPENFRKIQMILLPKDYLVFQFTGLYSTDYSDASGTLLLDVENKCWSKEMCEIVGIQLNQLPHLHESYEVVAPIRKELAAELGLSADVKIIAGAGDNAAAAIGTGCVNDQSCNISLGTSGTVFVSSDQYHVSNQEAVHHFNHATGKYHQMGCILSAASCNQWWIKEILKSNFEEELNGLSSLMGNNDVFFLPYLMGERCPHNDVSIRGAFIGLSASTSKEQMTLSVLEGVAFALKDCLMSIENQKRTISHATLCGGGAKSKIWAQIIADVLNIQLDFVKTEQGPGYGAAILAMVGCKEFSSVKEACKQIIKIVDTIKPEATLVEKYEKKYDLYRAIYPALKTLPTL